MDTSRLDKYKEKRPINVHYFRDPEKIEQYLKCDSPLAFLDLDTDKQEVLLDWCLSLNKIKSFNNGRSCYGMKHVFGNTENGFYVYSGAMKGAMIIAGFDVKNENELNWSFNVSKKSLKQVEKENRELVKNGSRS